MPPRRRTKASSMPASADALTLVRPHQHRHGPRGRCWDCTRRLTRWGRSPPSNVPKRQRSMSATEVNGWDQAALTYLSHHTASARCFLAPEQAMVLRVRTVPSTRWAASISWPSLLPGPIQDGFGGTTLGGPRLRASASKLIARSPCRRRAIGWAGGVRRAEPRHHPLRVWYLSIAACTAALLCWPAVANFVAASS
jgi:hypothetical protein